MFPEAEAAENAIIDGELLGIDVTGNTLVFDREDNDDCQPVRQSFTITSETIITLDGKPAKLVDLERHSALTLRLSDDGHTIRAIKVVSPDPDDEKPATDDL